MNFTLQVQWRFMSSPSQQYKQTSQKSWKDICYQKGKNNEQCILTGLFASWHEAHYFDTINFYIRHQWIIHHNFPTCGPLIIFESGSLAFPKNQLAFNIIMTSYSQVQLKMKNHAYTITLNPLPQGHHHIKPTTTRIVGFQKYPLHKLSWNLNQW